MNSKNSQTSDPHTLSYRKNKLKEKSKMCCFIKS